MAHIKQAGTTKGNRDSRSKRLGVKLSGGQSAKKGSIIIRQRGSKVRSGPGTRTGKDYTIFAIDDGIVKFYMLHGRQMVCISS